MNGGLGDNMTHQKDIMKTASDLAGFTLFNEIISSLILLNYLGL